MARRPCHPLDNLRTAAGSIGFSDRYLPCQAGLQAGNRPGYRLTPTVTGSLTSVTPNASRTPATTSRASASRSSVVASPRLVRASVCLVEIRAGPVPYPLVKPALSISQAAEVLVRPSPAGKAGGAASGPRRSWTRARKASYAACVEDRVGEEGPGRPGVVVLGVQHHALARAQLQYGLAGGGRRDTVAGLDAEGAGRLGVLERRRQPARVLQLEADPQDDIALGVLLEAAVAVREGALGVRDGDRLAGAAVVGHDLGDGAGDFLAVRADVLDRRGAGRAGDAGQALDAGEARLDGAGDGVRPDLARGQFQRRPREFEAAGRDAQRGAVEALVADDQVAAAADDQQRGTARRPPRARRRPPRRRWWP